MGVVYKARDLRLDRIVAIKTIAAAHHARTGSSIGSRSKPSAVARLKHPNVIRDLLDRRASRQRRITRFEYAEGGSLAQLLVERPMLPLASRRF